MQTIDLNKIRASIAPKPVIEVYEYLKVYRDDPKRAAWIKRRTKAWDCIENKIWSDEEKKQMKDAGQVPLVINGAVKGKQASSAITTDNRPEVKFLPIGLSDVYVSELLKRGHDVVHEKNDGGLLLADLVGESKTGGIGFIYVSQNMSKGPFGKIQWDEIDPPDCYWDSKSKKRDFSDTNIIIARLRTKGWIKDHYPDVTSEEMSFKRKDGGGEDGATSSGVTGADNYKIDAQDDVPDDGSTAEPMDIWEIEAWMLKTVKEDWVYTVEKNPKGRTEVSQQKVNPDLLADAKTDQEKAKIVTEKYPGGAYWPRTLEKREQRIIVGAKLVSSKINPFGEDSDGDPILPIIGLKHYRTRSSYPMSPTNYAVDHVKEQSKRRMQFIYAVSNNVNSPIVEPKGMVEWVGPNGEAGANPGTPGTRARVDKAAPFQPTRLTSGAFEAGKFVELEKLSEENIKDIYDAQDVMRGKLPASNMSGRSVLALQDLGGMMSKPFLKAFEAAITRLGKVDAAIMLKAWPRHMWERLIEDDEWEAWTPEGGFDPEDQTQPLEQRVEKKEEIKSGWENALDLVAPESEGSKGIEIIDIDVKVSAGSSMPTNRMAKREDALEYFKAGLYDPLTTLEYSDDPRAKQAVKRLEKMQQQQAMKGK